MEIAKLYVFSVRNLLAIDIVGITQIIRPVFQCHLGEFLADHQAPDQNDAGLMSFASASSIIGSA